MYAVSRRCNGDEDIFSAPRKIVIEIFSSGYANINMLRCHWTNNTMFKAGGRGGSGSVPREKRHLREDEVGIRKSTRSHFYNVKHAVRGSGQKKQSGHIIQRAFTRTVIHVRVIHVGILTVCRQTEP